MSDNIMLAIDGMTCEHCVAAVRTALAAVPGVDAVIEVRRDPGRAVVQGSASTTALIDAVRGAGYQAHED